MTSVILVSGKSSQETTPTSWRELGRHRRNCRIKLHWIHDEYVHRKHNPTITPARDPIECQWPSPENCQFPSRKDDEIQVKKEDDDKEPCKWHPQAVYRRCCWWMLRNRHRYKTRALLNVERCSIKRVIKLQINVRRQNLELYINYEAMTGKYKAYRIVDQKCSPK